MQRPTRRRWSAVLTMMTLLLGSVLSVAAAPKGPPDDRASKSNSEAEIHNEFDRDCRGFETRSSKEISYVEIHYVDGSSEKFENSELKNRDQGDDDDRETFEYRQDKEISHIFVKAGTTTERFDCTNGGGGTCPGGGGKFSLTPKTSENPVGSDHTVSARVRDADGNPCEGVQVRFEVDDAGNPSPRSGVATTGEDGRARFTFTNSEEATNKIKACISEDGTAPSECKGADYRSTAEKTWVDGGPPSCPGPDGNITLRPKKDTNPVGSDHTVTATVENAKGEPCEGAEVRFEVDDEGTPAPQTGTDTTDENGNAEFTFTNDEESTNTITACTDADGSLPDSCENADLTATAAKEWMHGDPEPALCRARVVKLFGEELILAEANPDGEPCVTENGPGINEGQVRIFRAQTNEDDTSATAELLGLGGTEGDPGGVSVLGAHADCGGGQGYILLITDGDGEDVARVGEQVPDLAMNEENGIFFAEAEEGDDGGHKAQALALRLQGDELVVVSEAEARCA